MNIKTFLTGCFFFLWGMANAQVQVPEKIIGNWVNEKNNSWEYGFFEDFAIYESDFWEYEAIQAKKNRVEIKLKKGNRKETLRLRLAATDNPTLTIARNKEKARKFTLHRTGALPAAASDTKAFKNSKFHPDTVTIIGYYRNLKELQDAAKNGRFNGPFKVSLVNFIIDKEVEYFADIDSLGRFKIKFPVLNTQEVYLDWKRLNHRDVVEPGETVFLFADMRSFIPTEDEQKSREGMIAYLSRPRHILYMGSEARLHNENVNYRAHQEHFNKKEALKNASSDMDYLAAARANYETRIQHLENYIKSHPNLSERFIAYQYASEKYLMAFYLLQYRFDKRITNEIAFDKEYMDFINSTMEFNDEKLFTLVREYSSFIRDYVGYNQEVKNAYKDEATGQLRFRGISVKHSDAWDILKSQGFLNEQEIKTISDHDAIMTRVYPELELMKDTAKIAEFMAPYMPTIIEYNTIKTKPDVNQAFEEVLSQLVSEKSSEAEFQHIDTLIQNTTLKELLIARELYRSLEGRKVPLSERSHQDLNKRIANQSVKDFVLAVNNYYINIDNKEISYLGSLKKTDHLKEARDADKLFSELIAPYKGKVIYVDFWGTWCGPCRENMPYANVVKKELAGKDVIFMYLANQSPEKSWQNVIKENDLVGENVVHFNLPHEQQDMIERKFAVNSFPSYFLIGKDGKIAKDKAPNPKDKDQLMSDINKLLTE